MAASERVADVRPLCTAGFSARRRLSSAWQRRRLRLSDLAVALVACHSLTVLIGLPWEATAWLAGSRLPQSPSQGSHGMRGRPSPRSAGVAMDAAVEAEVSDVAEAEVVSNSEVPPLGDASMFAPPDGPLPERPGSSVNAPAAKPITQDENEALLKKCQMGQMDFNDFLRVIMEADRQGGTSKVINQESPQMLNNAVPGAQLNSDEAAQVDGKFAKFSAILQAMTPAHRANPDAFLAPNAKARKLVEDVAAASGQPVSFVNEFLNEFQGTRSMFAKLSSGKTMEQATREVQEEAMDVQMARKSRRARRTATDEQGKKRVGKKKRAGGAQPEWMTL
eukprot:TRINITY_DN30779_c0_g1_i1.p1 TRINITY_DN30779_c0_g1~~TRINITY_DN30779_c0_g1_i1.p1  ORF type:complete len:335 (-),score=82.47 TRINITY_DN30779_c0_g1_i1:131-1135(-)